MIKADLHVHSCLSPCAEITMVPSVVAKAATEKELDVISITDHNACENLTSFSKRLKNLLLPGVELTSAEEVHVLAYFDSIQKTSSFCERVKKLLMRVDYDPELMGYEIVVDENDNFQRLEDRFYGVSLEISLNDLVGMICEYGGIPVYAHIERRFGVLYQLGIFPKDERVKIVEARSKQGWETAVRSGLVVMSNSDAHSPDEIGCRFTRFALETLSLQELFNILISPDRERILSIWD
ncbi:MAG: PHP domain-containing protein [Pseudothermotoga sp.]